MDDLFLVYKELEGKLGRTLEEKEKKFLQWVYIRHMQETDSQSVS
ncbi:hypothetical protein ACLIBH_01555 [Virgibacillus sp. W0430]